MPEIMDSVRALDEAIGNCAGLDDEQAAKLLSLLAEIQAQVARLAA